MLQRIPAHLFDSLGLLFFRALISMSHFKPIVKFNFTYLSRHFKTYSSRISLSSRHNIRNIIHLYQVDTLNLYPYPMSCSKCIFMVDLISHNKALKRPRKKSKFRGGFGLLETNCKSGLQNKPVVHTPCEKKVGFVYRLLGVTRYTAQNAKIYWQLKRETHRAQRKGMVDRTERGVSETHRKNTFRSFWFK